jgi:hypothetical protein
MATDRMRKPGRRERTLDPNGPPDPPTPTAAEDDLWDPYAAPEVPADAPAGETMPPRAARLASQNGPAMRAVFAYLLDEDDALPPPAPAPAPERKKRR